jgi:hypothetical protein
VPGILLQQSHVVSHHPAYTFTLPPKSAKLFCLFISTSVRFDGVDYSPPRMFLVLINVPFHHLFVFNGWADSPTVKQCGIPGPKAQVILQKEAEPRNHAHSECWNVLKCPYAWNKAHVATSTPTPNHCKQYRCDHVAGFAWKRHRVALWRVE